MKKITQFKLLLLIVMGCATITKAQTNVTVLEDAFVRGGESANVNYESDTGQPLLLVKISPSNDSFSRQTFLKFDVSNYSTITSAILHVSGSQTNSGDSFNVSVSKVLDDTWSESTITWNTMPTVSDAIGTFSTQALGNDVFVDYSVDVTSYIQEQLADNKIASFNLSDASSTNEQLKLEQKNVSGTAAYLSITGTVLDVESFNENTFSLYPNPLNSKQLTINSKKGIDKINIYSVNGANILSKPINSTNKIDLDLSSLSKGIYLVEILNTSGASSVKKLVKM